MAPQLRIIVAGLDGSGTALINAIVGQEVLPVVADGEAAVLVSVVPRQVEEGAVPVLHAYEASGDGAPRWQRMAEGDAAIRARIARLHREAPELGLGAECRVDALLRDSLNVFVPPAAEWHDTQFIDVGALGGLRDPSAQAGVELACRLAHRLLVCIPAGQLCAEATRDFLAQLPQRGRDLFDFDEALLEQGSPVMFVITEADAEGLDLDEAVPRLRAMLRAATSDLVAQTVPVLCVGAASGRAAQDWQRFDQALTSFAGCRRDILRCMGAHRAARILRSLDASLDGAKGEWPHHAAALWRSRRNFAKKAAIGTALVVSGGGTALAATAYLSAASAAAIAAAEAATASAQAGAAVAAANSWWAWLGFGSYGAAAAAATTTAASAQAVAAGAATSASAWGLASTLAGASTIAVGAAAVWSPGVVEVAGMRVATASTVGAQTARAALELLRFEASAGDVGGGATYRDVVFHPEGGDVSPLGAFPVLLRSRTSGADLCDYGGSVSCEAGVASGQLWWVLPAGDGRVRLRNATTRRGLGAEAGYLPLDPRLALRTAEGDGEEWVLSPCASGAVRLQHAPTSQYLFFDGLFAGCYGVEHPDQEWVVVPRVPLYIGDFVMEAMQGDGQLFSPSGAPLFKGRVAGGRPVEGFVFDEGSVCHGYFGFSPDGVPAYVGEQPEEVASAGLCARCGEQERLEASGRRLRPCGHGVVCEACAMSLLEHGACPLCHILVEGVTSSN